MHSIRYGETSLIARIYTRQMGLQAYLVPGVRKARARVRHNLFQPLTPVDLVAYHKERGGLQRIREIHCPEPYGSIPYEVVKSAIALFLAEVMLQSLHESDPNAPLFDHITGALRFLDGHKGSVANFHLVFLLQYSRFMGFQPRNNHDDAHAFFNLREGLFQPVQEAGNDCLDREQSRLLHEVAMAGFEDLPDLHVPAPMRRVLLGKLLDYFRHHLSGVREIRSRQVLETVLH